MPAGRPLKEGLDYFSMDTDILADQKIIQIRHLHPEKGFEVYVLLLIRIYKEHGYFIEWNKEQCLSLANDALTSKDKVLPVIESCLEAQLFDRNFYDRYGILTSTAIQDRYIRYAYRRKEVYIIRDFALFSPDLIGFYKIEKKAFYRIFDDVFALFDNGFLIKHWRRFAKFELIASSTHKKPETPAEEDTGGQGQTPVVPIMNGRIYGDPPPLPSSFDWDKEKEQLLADKEWRHLACHNFKLGSWNGRDFTPDYKQLDHWLQDYFSWAAISGNKQTVQGMKSHFTNWYPKRGQYLSQLPKDQRKSPLHLGNQDYENMIKW